MLYNFIVHKKYAIDIKEFKANLLKNSEYMTKNYAINNLDELMLRWVSLLMRLCNTNDGEVTKYHKNSQEIFQKYYHYETFDILLHFNVSYLDLNGHSAVTKNVPTKSVINLVDYDLVSNEDIFSYKAKELKPIYVVPFPTKRKVYLLVDGNHRLTYTLNQNLEYTTIKEFPVDVAAASLMSRFEQAFYCYLYELWEIQNYPSEKLVSWKSKISLFENIYSL